MATTEVELAGIRIEQPRNDPVLILREVGGHNVLPIWIGEYEAQLISIYLRGEEPSRPLTHDLLISVVEELGAEIESVEIVGLHRGTFIGELVFDGGDRVTARPSDAVALAVRLGVPIRVATEIMDEAAIHVADDKEDQMEQFREFLDHISPDDFAGGESGPRE